MYNPFSLGLSPDLNTTPPSVLRRALSGYGWYSANRTEQSGVTWDFYGVAGAIQDSNDDLFQVPPAPITFK
jgi:hypothetical protein